MHYKDQSLLGCVFLELFSYINMIFDSKKIMFKGFHLLRKKMQPVVK